MGFFRKGQSSDDGDRISTTALVLHATAPPEGGPTLGPGSHGDILILADPGSGKRKLHDKLRLTEEHWLVPGMEVPVRFDRSEPDRFEIDWDSIPGMEARAAANDPALADPVSARRKAAQAEGLTTAETGSTRTERFRRALAQRGDQPAPPGKVRAVVMIASIRGRRRIVGDATNDVSHDMLTYERKSAAVLSVNPLGQAPYALYVRKFKCEVDLVEPTWTPLPALVSAQSQTDVEILWDEVPSHETQLMNRIASSVASQQAQRERADALRSQLADTIADGAHPDPGTAVQSEMQKLAADNAKRALGFVTDPKTRKMLVDQYRAAGIDIAEDDRIP